MIYKYILLSILLAGLSSPLQAQDASYLSGMPSPAVVMARINAKTDVDTYARQAGAFVYLKDIIRQIASNRREGEAKKLILQYNEAIESLKTSYENSSSPGKLKWPVILSEHSSDKALLEEVLNNLIAPRTKARYFELKEAKPAQLKQESPAIVKKVIEKLPSVLAIILGYFSFRNGRKKIDFVNRRAFERTNASGVQVFDDFDDLKKKSNEEGWAGGWGQLFAAGGLIMLIVGIISLFF